jgi:hypothetical protein
MTVSASDISPIYVDAVLYTHRSTWEASILRMHYRQFQSPVIRGLILKINPNGQNEKLQTLPRPVEL